jgi:hypothetical protein
MGKNLSPLIKIPNDIRKDLVLDFDFGEDVGSAVVDHSEIGNNGVIVGASRLLDSETGKYLLNFDGVDDVVNVTTSAPLVGKSYVITYRITDKLVQDSGFFWQNNGFSWGKQGPNSWLLYMTTGTQREFFRDVEPNADGEFHQDVLIYNANHTACLFRDGVFVETFDGHDFETLTASNLFEIGKRDLPFPCKLKYFRIYNAILDSTQIANLWIRTRKKLGYRPRL